jgi:hypothetical protein
VLAGEAAELVTQYTKAFEVNQFHFAEELAAAAFSSFVLPKHSHLKVILHNSCTWRENYVIYKFVFKVLLPVWEVISCELEKRDGWQMKAVET